MVKQFTQVTDQPQKASEKQHLTRKEKTYLKRLNNKAIPPTENALTSAKKPNINNNNKAKPTNLNNQNSQNRPSSNKNNQVQYNQESKRKSSKDNKQENNANGNLNSQAPQSKNHHQAKSLKHQNHQNQKQNHSKQNSHISHNNQQFKEKNKQHYEHIQIKGQNQHNRSNSKNSITNTNTHAKQPFNQQIKKRNEVKLQSVPVPVPATLPQTKIQSKSKPLQKQKKILKISNQDNFKKSNTKSNVKRDQTNANKIQEQGLDQQPIQFVQADVDENLTSLKNEQSKQPKVIKHNRLIIRNLVFDINQKHIRKLLSPYGTILEVNIPKNADNKGAKGFAFVEFQNRNHCLKAIKQLNGTLYKGRNIILDQSVSKQRFMENKVNQEINQNNQEEKIEKMEQQNKAKVKVQAKQQEQQQQNQEKMDEEAKEVKVQPHVKKEKKEKQPQNLQQTIFIRNLPINVTEEELHKFFRRYGKLKFAKVVKNNQTGTSKGSAFVKFDDSQKAKELVEYSKSYQMSMLGKSHDFKMNPAINLQLQGTILNIFPVQRKDQINEKIKIRDNLHKDHNDGKDNNNSHDDKKKKPIKKIRHLDELVTHDTQNKRKLNLALLGMWKATDQMKHNDYQKFKSHEKQKVQKLKNPNNSVSDTRIILKFLKKDITQDQIRQLCHQFLTQTGQKHTALTYCKLMMTENMTKSAGFAFVQFKNHEISLGFLQWICQSPTKVMQYPFVCQFAIQDSRKMMKIHNKSKKNHPHHAAESSK